MRRSIGTVLGGLLLAACGDDVAPRRVLHADISGVTPRAEPAAQARLDSLAFAAIRAAAPPPPRVDAGVATLILHGASAGPTDSTSWQAPVAARATGAGWAVIRLARRPIAVAVMPNEVPVAVDTLVPAIGGLVVLPERLLQPITRAQLERCDAGCLLRLRGGEARAPVRVAER